MNESGESCKLFITCRLTENTYVILSHFSNEKYERHQIAVLIVNCMLFFSTISLNGISIITIRKSSQLRSKVCYFVVLLQSLVDFVVGVLGIPLFVYYLSSPFLETKNCDLIILALRSTHFICGLSYITLVTITVERYIGVMYPYYYQSNVTKKRILKYFFRIQSCSIFANCVFFP